MPTVTLNLPAEKVKPFLSVIAEVGFHEIQVATSSTSSSSNKQHKQQTFSSPKMTTIPEWDVYHNELEFE